jgi:pyruvate/2-oxoglutarate dehydrogenase complex dihydrolipoamide acyltransferase (E2) component
MDSYETRPFAPQREIVVDAGYLAHGRHIIYALLEVDVTRPREILRRLAADEGASLSFTAFIAASLGRAVAADPGVQAYRDWRRRLVVFQDVDVVVMIEPRRGAVAIPHIIRAAQRKSARQISDEIRRIQADPGQSAQSSGAQSSGAQSSDAQSSDAQSSGQRSSGPRGSALIKLAPRLPRFVRMLYFWALKKNPHWFKQTAGTVVITSVGMFGKGAGWGIAFLPTHNLGLTVGGIAQKPGVFEGRIEPREILHLTLAFDHDVVDGAPAARFARLLVELLESAALLEEAAGEAETASDS